MTNRDALQDLPKRAQIGYVLKHATVKQGELDPALVVGILAHKGLEIDDTEAMRDLAHETMIHNSEVDYDG